MITKLHNHPATEITFKISKNFVIVDSIYKELFTVYYDFNHLLGHILVPKDEYLILHERDRQDTFVLCFGHRNKYGAASLVCKKCKRYHPSRRFDKPVYRMEAILFEEKKRRCVAFVVK